VTRSLLVGRTVVAAELPPIRKLFVRRAIFWTTFVSPTIRPEPWRATIRGFIVSQGLIPVIIIPACKW